MNIEGNKNSVHNFFTIVYFQSPLNQGHINNDLILCNTKTHDIS